MKSRPRILFITGTRADFGKLKPLILRVHESGTFEAATFVTGMHMLEQFGNTWSEVRKSRVGRYALYNNHQFGESMDRIVASTIVGLSEFVTRNRPDLIVVHGDRVETLAAATVGALNNILVAHIEGGEVSGTVDELIRHSTSKLSHVHFVANEDAGRRLEQLGERRESIWVIGSPDIDVMNSANLPPMALVRRRYAVPFEEFGLAIFHPVTTELSLMESHATEFVGALVQSKFNWVVIMPNNDHGSDEIRAAYRTLLGNERFQIFPSIRFEYFLTLMKNARCIVGNSSAGIREAPHYGLPVVNVGTRQFGRLANSELVFNSGNSRESILSSLERALACSATPEHHFGDGRSAERFMLALTEPRLWATPRQKTFVDLEWHTTS